MRPSSSVGSLVRIRGAKDVSDSVPRWRSSAAFSSGDSCESCNVSCRVGAGFLGRAVTEQEVKFAAEVTVEIAGNRPRLGSHTSKFAADLRASVRRGTAVSDPCLHRESKDMGAGSVAAQLRDLRENQDELSASFVRHIRSLPHAAECPSPPKSPRLGPAVAAEAPQVGRSPPECQRKCEAAEANLRLAEAKLRKFTNKYDSLRQQAEFTDGEVARLMCKLGHAQNSFRFAERCVQQLTEVLVRELEHMLLEGEHGPFQRDGLGHGARALERGEMLFSLLDEFCESLEVVFGRLRWSEDGAPSDEPADERETESEQLNSVAVQTDALGPVARESRSRSRISGGVAEQADALSQVERESRSRCRISVNIAVQTDALDQVEMESRSRPRIFERSRSRSPSVPVRIGGGFYLVQPKEVPASLEAVACASLRPGSPRSPSPTRAPRPSMEENRRTVWVVSEDPSPTRAPRPSMEELRQTTWRVDDPPPARRFAFGRIAPDMRPLRYKFVAYEPGAGYVERVRTKQDSCFGNILSRVLAP